MKECHCVFVQSCSWTTALSLVILMPVPLPFVISSLCHHRSVCESCLDLELLVGIRLLTGLTLISVSCWFHTLYLFPPASSLCCSHRAVFVCFLSPPPVSDPPEFSLEQPTHIQVLEDDVATIPLLVSANPEEVSCVWLHRGVLVRGEPRPCDGSINQAPFELSQQTSTQRCHSGSE